MSCWLHLVWANIDPVGLCAIPQTNCGTVRHLYCSATLDWAVFTLHGTATLRRLVKVDTGTRRQMLQDIVLEVSTPFDTRLRITCFALLSWQRLFPQMNCGADLHVNCDARTG